MRKFKTYFAKKEANI